MRELCELTMNERAELVDRIEEVMKNEYQISENSIAMFWTLFTAGADLEMIA